MARESKLDVGDLTAAHTDLERGGTDQGVVQENIRTLWYRLDLDLHRLDRRRFWCRRRLSLCAPPSPQPEYNEHCDDWDHRNLGTLAAC